MDSNLNPQPSPAPVAPTPAPAPTAPSTPEPTLTPIQGAPTSPSAAPTDSARKSSPKRLILFIILALAVILGIVFIIKIFGGGNEEAKKEAELIDLTYDESILLAVRKDDKYGYINLKGEMVIEPKYRSASDFIGDYAVARRDEDGFDIVIDKKGEEKLVAESRYATFGYDAENGLWYTTNHVYDKKLKRLAADNITLEYKDGYVIWGNSETGETGIMNAKGKITYTHQPADSSVSTSYAVSDVDANLANTYCIVKDYTEKKSTYGIINCDNGKEIVAMQDQYIGDEDNNHFQFYDGDYERVRSIYIQNDKIVIDTPHELSIRHYDTYAAIYDYDASYDERTSYIAYDAEAPQKDRPSGLDEDEDSELSEWESTTGLTVFSCNKGYGLMSGEKVSVPCEYDSITPPDAILYKYLKKKGKDYLFATKEDKIYIITSTGKQVAELNGSHLKTVTTSTFIQYTDNESEQTVLYNLLTGKSVTLEDKDVSSYINLYPLYATVRIGDKTTYFNKDLDAFYEYER